MSAVLGPAAAHVGLQVNEQEARLGAAPTGRWLERRARALDSFLLSRSHALPCRSCCSHTDRRVSAMQPGEAERRGSPAARRRAANRCRRPPLSRLPAFFSSASYLSNLSSLNAAWDGRHQKIPRALPITYFTLTYI